MIPFVLLQLNTAIDLDISRLRLSTSLKFPRKIVSLESPPRYGKPPDAAVYLTSRKYKSGGVGSLTHSILLHGQKYETQLSIFADGYTFRLFDLYFNPRLYIRFYLLPAGLLMTDLLRMKKRSSINGTTIRFLIRLRRLWLM